MQPIVELDFLDLNATPQVQELISKHVSELEHRFGRLTACRVAIKGPGHHHRTSGLYEVHIRLVLPDSRELVSRTTPTADERYANLTFAINEAFRHARRSLEDQVHRLEGHVKSHEGQLIGTVTKLAPSGEFGFIESADGDEIYFHRNSVLHGAYSRLGVGSKVTYVEEAGEKGAQASTVKLLGKHKRR